MFKRELEMTAKEIQPAVSRWVEIVVGDPVSSEQTIVGVIVFDREGKYFGHRLGSFERARHRGDLNWDWTEKDCEEWISTFVDVPRVERYLTSIGSAMSWNRLSNLCGALMTPQTLLDDLTRRMTCFKPFPEDQSPDSPMTQVQRMICRRHPDPSHPNTIAAKDYEIDL